MSDGFSPVALGAFELFFRPWLRRRLRILIAGLPRALPPQPVLLAANHVSWWDPFLLREVHRLVRPRAPIYSLMLRSELERQPFFKRIGAIGIEPGSAAGTAAALSTLRARLIARPDSFVSFFPQGSIWPSTRRPLGFRPGIRVFARRLRPITVIPVSIHLEPLNRTAPAAFVLLGEPLAVAEGSAPEPDLLEARVEEGIDRILSLLSDHGESAVEHWPALGAAGPHATRGDSSLS